MIDSLSYNLMNETTDSVKKREICIYNSKNLINIMLFIKQNT
jgi:hypothetical protein